MFDIKPFARRIYSFRHVLLRGAIFAAAWFFLPAWLFVLVALGLYFLPFFRSTRFVSSFLGLFVMYFFAPATAAYALLGGIGFAWLLGIREMLFIDRRASFEMLTIALSFFLLRLFYLANPIVRGVSLLWAIGLAILIGWMVWTLMGIAKEKEEAESQPFYRLAGWLSVLLFSEIIIACLFLPLDMAYQSVIAFLLAAVVIDLAPNYLLGDVSRKKVLAMASVIFGALVLVIASAPLGL
jgi:hypothetical protein